MQKVVVYDYTNIGSIGVFGEPKVQVLTVVEFLSFLDRNKKTDLKIAVYEVGECLLDWS